MSPRAASRLEQLGFGEVYDYVGSKMDWIGAGLAWEGTAARVTTLGALAEAGVATCGLDDTVGGARAVPSDGPPICLVLDARRVVLGLVRAEALELDGSRPITAVMQEGPSTYRPHVPVTEMAERLARHPEAYLIVTTLDGRLVGVADAAAVRERGGMSRFRLGYWLSSEEHGPDELVDLAARAEQVGFGSAMVSDHFHPWVPAQGQSPFVWAVLGGIARSTTRLRVGTGVTAPILRMHPAVVAQAAATAAVMLPDRFFLGLGSGERLNEQVVGRRWPAAAERRAMLEEAVTVIRRLLDGEEVTHAGAHHRVEHARLFTLPERPPPIYLAGSSTAGAVLAGRAGDGFIGVAPSQRHVQAFEGSGGAGKPRLGQVHLCWATTEDEARATALRVWPNGGMPGALLGELARPAAFAKAARLVRVEDVEATVVCGPDPRRHLDAITAFAAAGFSEVYLHQVGPDQEGFFRFYEENIFPALR